MEGFSDARLSRANYFKSSITAKWLRKAFIVSHIGYCQPVWCSIVEVRTAWKVSKYGVFSGLYFPVFGLNREIYSVNFRIQSEYRKIWIRKNSVFGHLLHSVEQTYKHCSWALFKKSCQRKVFQRADFKHFLRKENQ